VRLLTREQSQALDRLTHQRIPEEHLMQEAARACFSAMLQMTKLPRVLIFAGPGQNGQDGFWLAQLCKEAGWDVHIHPWQADGLAAAPKGQRADSLRLQSQTMVMGDFGSALEVIPQCGIVVDAIFGAGLNRPLGPVSILQLQSVQVACRKAKIPILAVDSPTGLDLNTGRLWGGALAATRTVTMGAAKPGFFMEQGPRVTRQLRIAKLSFADADIKSLGQNYFLFGPQAARQILGSLSPVAHKATQGRLRIYAGSDQYPGASLLCLRSAGRTGVGYLELVTRGNWFRQVGRTPEVLCHPWGATLSSKPSALVFGPGLGLEAEVGARFEEIRRQALVPVVLDADGLTVFANSGGGKLPRNWILTPHQGELTRLLGWPSEQVAQDRVSAAAELALRTQAIVVAKGYRTVVTNGEKKAIIFAGNSALAKAGSGDVLTGMIGSFLAQGLVPFEAACLGAYVHGMFADLWVKSGKNPRALLPSDLDASTCFEALDRLVPRLQF